jgi:trehalose 6-phosphate phosphatase
VPAPTAETLAQRLGPVTEAPQDAGLFFDVDGTLAPIVQRAEDAHVPEKTSRKLGELARRYRLVAAVSGRSAADARRLVGVGGIAYAGSHGAELMDAHASKPTVMPAFASWGPRVHEFAAGHDDRELRRLRVRLEDKGPIMAFHWRGAPDEDAARTRVEGIAHEAETEGLATHWGRKVLEVRPPVEIDKGRGIRRLLRDADLAAAVYVGDDRTDVDAFAGLRALAEQGRLGTAVCVGVQSDETPPELEEAADALVDGPAGVRGLLETLL